MRKKNIDVVLINGGMTFKKKRDYLNYLKFRTVCVEEKVKWNKDYLKYQLKDYCRLIKPQMPCLENAKYKDWKIHFERYIELFNDKVILLGNSLGGIFLVKYLSENNFPKKIISLYLIAAPFDNTLEGEDLVGGFKLKKNLSLINKNTNKINMLFSMDDEVVPISHANKYIKKLPNAKIRYYKNKNGHFSVEKFPELIKMIRNDINNK